MSFSSIQDVKGDHFFPCRDLTLTRIIYTEIHSVLEKFGEHAKIFKRSPVLRAYECCEVLIKAVSKFLLHNLDICFRPPSVTDHCDDRKKTSKDIKIWLSGKKSKKRRDQKERTKESTEWLDLLDLVDSVSESELESTCEVPRSQHTLKNLQFGIKKSLHKLSGYPDRDVLMTDFTMVEVQRFNVNEESHCRWPFTLHAYAPVAFRYFREVFGITTEDFLKSICDAPLCICEKGTSSGRLLYYSFDDRFIIKTVPKEDAKFLMKLFPGYFLNLVQHSKTLLPKFFGLYGYEVGTDSFRVLIMNNVLPRALNICEKFDLKGSTYSRRRSAPEKGNRGSVTLKDLDLLDRRPGGFYLGNDIFNMLMKTIARDCSVLQSYHIMDYSLLVGVFVPDDSKKSEINIIFEPPKGRKSLSLNPFVARTDRGEVVYLFLGVIDILQSYDWKKRCEHHLKSLIYRRSTVSVAKPDFYSWRFQEFLKEHVFKCIPNLERLE